MRPGQAQRRHRGRGRPPPMCDAPLTNPSLSHIPTRLPSPRCLLTANGQIICTTHRKANVWLMPHCVHTTIQIPHNLLTIMLALYIARNPLYTRRSVKCYTVVLWLTSYFLSWAVAWLIFLALRCESKSELGASFRYITPIVELGASFGYITPWVGTANTCISLIHLMIWHERNEIRSRLRNRINL